MKRSLKKLKGLPGGPNEKIFSTDGYRSTSPDVNNPFNIIPSGNITMKEKDGSPLRKGPLMGTDNLGNSQIMFPGADYQFPGNMVIETSLAKRGGQFQNSNITATNKLFKVNKLFKKRKKGKRARGIYNPKAKYTYDDGGEIELEIDEKDIDKYVKGGYIVEDISVPSLTRMDDGGERRKRRKNKTQQTEEITSMVQPIAPDNIGQVIEKPEVEVNPAPERVPLMMKFSNEFQENNPYDAYYEKAAYDYLKKQKGWNEALGINKSNLPENVAKRIQNKYYKDLEDYVIKQSKNTQKQYFGKFDKKGNWISSSGNKNILNPLEKKPTGNGPWNNWGDSGVEMVYPEQLVMGPGAGLLGLVGRGAAKGIANLANTSLVQGTKAALSQPIRNIPGLTVGNLGRLGFGINAALEFADPTSGTREAVNTVLDSNKSATERTAAGAEVGLQGLMLLDTPGMGNALKAVGKGVAMAPEAISNLGKFIGTEEGLLSNAYKVNPFAFKPNPEAYYRGIGKAGLEDAIQSGVFRQAGFDNKNYNNYKGVWYATGDRGLAKARDFSKDYIAEVPRTAFPEIGDEFFGSALFPTRATQRHIPIEEGRILQKDWLRGYKEVPVELPGSPNAIDNTQGLTGFSIGSGTNFTRDIPNPDYYLDVMKLNKYNPKQKKYFESLIQTVKNQGNVATELQYDELQRIKTGDYNYGKKGYYLDYTDILNQPSEEILNKTGRSKEDWQLFINKLPDRYGKLLEEQFNSAYEPTNENLQTIEQGKNQLLDFYSSSDYNNRLQRGLGIDFNDALDYQNSLINAINKTNVRYLQSKNLGSIESDAIAYTSGADASGTKLGIDFSKRGLNRPDAKYVVSHEFGHTSLFDNKTQKLLENLPKLELDSETLKLWESEAAKPGGESYKDLIEYYKNPDEARQRGISTILFSKNSGISIDELVDMPYNQIIYLNQQGKIPSDVVSLRQLYDQKQLKSYLKNLFSIVGPIVIGGLGTNLALENKKDGGIVSNLTKKEIDKLIKQGYIIEEID